MRRRWLVWSQDVTRAFLQSDTKYQKKKIAIRPPKELGESQLWFLLLVLYGLRGAPAAWWLTFKKVMLGLGFSQARNDPAFFLLKIKLVLHGLLHVHVDDNLCCGDEVFEGKIQLLRQELTFGARSSGTFVHLGLNIVQNLQTFVITIDQFDYVDKFLEEFDMAEKKGEKKGADDVELTAREKDGLRRVAGGLTWVGCMTRPDALAVASQCTGLTRPTKLHLRLANKMVRTLKYNKKSITFNALDEEVVLVSFGDAALKNAEKGRTQGGTVIALANKRQLNKEICNVVLLAWTSGRIKRVVLNTYGGELLQQVATFDHASWVAQLYQEVRCDLESIDLHQFCDGLSVVENITLSLRQQVREKRLTADLWMLREAIADGTLTALRHVPTEFMIADALTKVKVDSNAILMLHDAMEGRIKMYVGPPHSSNQLTDAKEQQQHVPRRKEKRVDVKVPQPPSDAADALV